MECLFGLAPNPIEVGAVGVCEFLLMFSSLKCCDRRESDKTDSLRGWDSDEEELGRRKGSVGRLNRNSDAANNSGSRFPPACDERWHYDSFRL